MYEESMNTVIVQEVQCVCVCGGGGGGKGLCTHTVNVKAELAIRL